VFLGIERGSAAHRRACEHLIAVAGATGVRRARFCGSGVGQRACQPRHATLLTLITICTVMYVCYSYVSMYS
jgi:hypothetical protein